MPSESKGVVAISFRLICKNISKSQSCKGVERPRMPVMICAEAATSSCGQDYRNRRTRCFFHHSSRPYSFSCGLIWI